ncbi:hypothetical protein BWQ96_06923 [Gracilariopsis chorda]|uniref:Uncharacterized protein n=1 Tax=Gracilariopsis chorda TaxID=448386 RepID=A0A2V3IQE1_9FLOR|nr:hypothetical protein BWQ96_06923 [Gracilariopsis chorda]|eukprot:PXF43360.1 hypothetical protein BWQ96_06923 [Gracilariopsis chorda]
MAFVNSVPLTSSLKCLSGHYRCRSTSRRIARSRSVVRMQTWSDPAVTKEYMDYLSGIDQREEKSDCQSTIVGLGRIGDFLRSQGDGTDLVILRGEQIPPDAPGPVYLCTRNDDLEDIIKNCPPEKKDDLVFLQNGMLERFLRKYDCSTNTRANLYFSVTKKGADPIDGITETDPEGLTTVCGKWEGAFAERLEKAGLTCKVLKERDFRRSQLEKLIWISVFNLLGAVHGKIPVGEVARMHVKEVTEMGVELATMIRFTLTVGMMPNIEKRLIAYGNCVKDFPTALKEFKWRNGFFYDYSMLAKRNGLPDPTPMHTGYLEDGKSMGLIDW